MVEIEHHLNYIVWKCTNPDCPREDVRWDGSDSWEKDPIVEMPSLETKRESTNKEVSNVCGED